MTFRNFRIIPCLFLMLLFPSLLHAGSSPCDSRFFFFGAALDGYPITTERLKSVAHDMGTSPEMVVFFLQWPSVDDQKSSGFQEVSLNAIWETGAIPCLT